MLISIRTLGMERIQGLLASAGPRLQVAMEAATHEGLATVLEAVRSGVRDSQPRKTSRPTGDVAASVQSEMKIAALGVEGRVFSKLDRAFFVDRGTQQHGQAQRMFEKGLESSRERVLAGFSYRVSGLFE